MHALCGRQVSIGIATEIRLQKLLVPTWVEARILLNRFSGVQTRGAKITVRVMLACAG